MIPAPSYSEIMTKANAQAATWLLEIEDRRQQYLAQDVSFIGATACDGLPRAKGPGNPTQRRGIQLTEVRNAGTGFVIRRMLNNAAFTKKARIPELRRLANQQKHSGERGRPGWSAGSAGLWRTGTGSNYPTGH